MSCRMRLRWVGESVFSSAALSGSSTFSPIFFFDATGLLWVQPFLPQPCDPVEEAVLICRIGGGLRGQSMEKELLEEARRLVETALKEDRAAFDVTTQRLFRGNPVVRARIEARQGLLVCGLWVAELAFRQLDPKIQFSPQKRDCDWAGAGETLALVRGGVRAVLGAERTALNILSLLCGAATETARFVRVAQKHEALVLDTRKTIPGMRRILKYAVRVGGGFNHRIDLSERVMVKDNHKRLLEGDPRKASFWRHVWGLLGDAAEDAVVEAESVEEALAAAEAGFRHIMLDNMEEAVLWRAVWGARKHGAKFVEVSGGVRLERLDAILGSWADGVSVGRLTLGFECADVALEVEA